jgi:tetratricopeptide (TPR) repeat protein
MDREIYERVKDLAIEMTNSSANEDRRSRWKYYQKLNEICLENEKGDKDHPFQWEALADYTDDPIKALELYEKASTLSELFGLKEYSASVCLAMAERYKEIGNITKAREKAQEANEWAKNISDLDLRQEISEFLLNEL